ncbi:hypothetical protein [Rhodococcus sp. X156]|uniref:hypothetical protein n=1 Tax=Rhodococcus sp. X156 TaxID=2499145 RepID=UPI000FDB4314|nr:hypothetical protein [Rhodococcus sp. X156]
MWRSLFGRGSDEHAPSEPEPTPVSKPFPDRMRAELRKVSWTARGAGAVLPVAALPELGRIEDVLIPLVEHLRHNPPTMDEEIAVESMVTDYLPTTINAYLSLNPQYAKQVRPDGRTPGDDLLEQMRMLEQAIRDLAQAVYAHDAQQLEVQGRFLSSKFTRSDLEL